MSQPSVSATKHNTERCVFHQSYETVIQEINFPVGLNRDGLTGEVSVLQTLALKKSLGEGPH